MQRGASGASFGPKVGRVRRKAASATATGGTGTSTWAAAHQAEQRRMARQARCNRVHSAVTCQVNVAEAGKVNVHVAFLKFASGQLPFPG